MKTILIATYPHFKLYNVFQSGEFLYRTCINNDPPTEEENNKRLSFVGSKRRAYTPMTTKEIKTLVHLRNEGKSFYEIERLTGRTFNTLQKYMRDYDAGKFGVLIVTKD